VGRGKEGFGSKFGGIFDDDDDDGSVHLLHQRRRRGIQKNKKQIHATVSAHFQSPHYPFPWIGYYSTSKIIISSAVSAKKKPKRAQVDSVISREKQKQVFSIRIFITQLKVSNRNRLASGINHRIEVEGQYQYQYRDSASPFHLFICT
jgi:hypothetical protein